MKKQVWNSGPPPSLGWWPASVAQDAEFLRWWDGNCWSEPVARFRDAKYASNKAKEKDTWGTFFIEWTDRPASWPARSRT